MAVSNGNTALISWICTCSLFQASEAWYSSVAVAVGQMWKGKRTVDFGGLGSVSGIERRVVVKDYMGMFKKERDRKNSYVT